MTIRKEYRFEASHVVRGCFTEKCSKTFHGHSYIVEFFIESSSLDKADMVMDFGKLKPYLGSLIDTFDHSLMIWEKELVNVSTFMKENNQRWIEMSLNPSAESIALTLLKYGNLLVEMISRSEEEDYGAVLNSVIVHETATGYARADLLDLKVMPKVHGKQIRIPSISTHLMQNGGEFIKILKAEGCNFKI